MRVNFQKDVVVRHSFLITFASLTVQQMCDYNSIQMSFL